MNSGLLYEKLHYNLSSEHSTFLKEGNKEKRGLTGVMYFVVTDKAGEDWLLKDPGGGGIVESAEEAEERVWGAGLSEVYGYNIAYHLGYPVAQTRLVKATIESTDVNERPFIAYRFIRNHIDVKHNDDNFSSLISSVSNQSDIDFRRVFNWLIGSHQDGSRQAIISLDDNRYYAIDISATEGIHWPMPSHDHYIQNPRNRHEATVFKAYCLVDNHKLRGYNCIQPIVSAQNVTHIGGYFKKLEELIDKNVVLSKLSLESGRANRLAESISERAAALSILYELGKLNLANFR